MTYRFCKADRPGLRLKQAVDKSFLFPADASPAEMTTRFYSAPGITPKKSMPDIYTE